MVVLNTSKNCLKYTCFICITDDYIFSYLFSLIVTKSDKMIKDHVILHPNITLYEKLNIIPNLKRQSFMDRLKK